MESVHEQIYFLKINLSKIQHFEEGDILKMPGLKIVGSPLYNHHVIYSSNVYLVVYQAFHFLSDLFFKLILKN